tara:strand:- start:437 stop:1228 length:792 start_codon:yes stop_codon:yes gene_type:complete
MRVAVIRHGIGREADKVLPFLENGIYKELKNLKDINFDFFYLYREVKKECSILNNEKEVTSIFTKLSFEKIVKLSLPDDNYKLSFEHIFLKDINKDNFQSYGFLLNQCYMFKKFVDLIDIEKYDSFVVLRDDVLIISYRNIEELIKNSLKGYVTSIWDWEAGVHDRFFMCPKDLFFKLSFKYDELRSIDISKGKVNARKYTGEKITLGIINKNNYKIYPYNIKTLRVRIGPRLARERHRIRIHDLSEVFNIITNFIKSRILNF